MLKEDLPKIMHWQLLWGSQKSKVKNGFLTTATVLGLCLLISVFSMSNYIPISEITFEFAVRITKLCSYLDKQSGTPRFLANQLFRAGTSIGANIEESRGAESDKDFISKQSIALKEAKETKYWLRLLIKSEIMIEKQVGNLIDECEQLIRIIAKSIVTSKDKLNK